jgi:hypothetical protein
MIVGLLVADLAAKVNRVCFNFTLSGSNRILIPAG